MYSSDSYGWDLHYSENYEEEFLDSCGEKNCECFVKYECLIVYCWSIIELVQDLWHIMIIMKDILRFKFGIAI